MRVKVSVASRRRKKRIKKAAKGYWGARHRWYKLAKEAVVRAGVYAYRDRKQKKRFFRRLWITKINAFLRQYSISYSKFMKRLKDLGVEINRKSLAQLAQNDKEAFEELIKRCQSI